MNGKEYWQDLLRARASRRRLLNNAALGGAGLFAIATGACGGTKSASTTSSGKGSGAANAGQPTSGGRIAFRAAGDAPTLDPTKTFLTTATANWGMVYSRLLRPNSGPQSNPNSLDPQPDLAERYEAPDPATYIFHLRQGVKFQDVAPVSGRALVADDVRYAYQRNIAAKGSPTASVYDGVSSIQAVDPSTVKIALSGPYADFLNNMASQYTWVYPHEIENSLDKTAIGTGPYILRQWVRESHFTLDRNPTYWRQGRPYTDGVDLNVIPDSGAALNALRTGQTTLDALNSIAQADALRKSNPEMVLIKQTPLETNFHVGPNVRKKPFDDERVRQALSVAINRERIMSDVWKDQGQESGPIPHAFMGRSDPYALADLGPNYQYNPDKAKQLLSAAAATNLNTDLRYTTDYNPPAQQIAALLKEDWQKVGVTVQVIPMEYGAFWSLYQKGDANLAVSRLGSGVTTDYYANGVVSSKGSRNLVGMNDPTVDQLALKQHETVDPKARVQVLQQEFDYLTQKMYWIWLSDGDTYYAMQPFVKNFRPNNFGTQLYYTAQLQDVWLAKH